MVESTADGTTAIPYAELTAAQIAAIEAAPCDMRHSSPYDFAWCETHDKTFALGSVCPFHPSADG